MTSGAHYGTNPLPFLLEEERYGDRQAMDAVFLSFNADAGFFEARILGACLSAGARVCVVADGTIWRPDPYGTKHAGRSYHLALASRRGAFHPKLVLLIGPKRALAVIGSGNLTMGGWQHNAETWTVIRGDLDECPAVLAAVADAVDGMARDGLDDLATQALTRAAQSVRNLLGATARVIETGHRILSSTNGPIVTQLDGPVLDLLVHAPFHDPGARGIAALLEALRPRRVQVMVQPHLTVVDPAALERALRACGAEWSVVQDAEGDGLRYRHGKLIEWTTSDGYRHALTGSPNLTWSALCASSSTGNTELAIVSPVRESLFPVGSTLDISEVPHVVLPQGEKAESGTFGRPPLLLSAVLDADSLRLTLSGPLVTPGLLELSIRSLSPEVWDPLAEVMPGNAQPVVTLVDPIPANSRVRLRLAGGEAAGQLVFVTDPSSVLRRHLDAKKSRTAEATTSDLLGSDLRIIKALARDLDELVADLSATRAPHTAIEGGAPTGEREVARDSDVSAWLWAQDQAAERHGPHLAAFGLGMPAPPAGMGIDARLPWVDVLVDNAEAALSDDTADTVDANPETEVETPVPPDHTTDHAKIREARRRRTARWAQSINAVPVASSLIVLRLALVWWSAGDWDDDDPQPHHVVAAMLRALARRDTKDSRELNERIASLGVVALTMMADRVDLSVRDDATLSFLRLRDDLAYLVLDVRPDLVEEYCQFLKRPSGFGLNAEQVLEMVREWGTEDPLADAIAVLEANGYEVTMPGTGLLRVSGAFSDVDRVARTAAGLVPETVLPVGVWAISESTQRWAFVLWDRPNLIKAVPGPRGVRWRQQRLGPLRNPVTSVDDDGAHVATVKHGPMLVAPPLALEMMARLGVHSPDPTGS